MCHTDPNSVCFAGGFLGPRRGDEEEESGRVLSSRGPSRLAEDSVSVEREEEERGEGGQGERDLSRWFSVLLSREMSPPVPCTEREGEVIVYSRTSEQGTLWG